MSVMELLASRRTYRRFEQKAVPQDVVDDIIEAVRLSSCGANRQAVRLVIVNKPEDVARVQPLVKWAAYLPPEQGTPKADELPTLYVAVVQDTSIPGDLATDTGIALAMIAALKGYRMKLLMPDNMSQERRAAMRAYGAELILVTKEQGMEGARDLALEMANRGEGKLLDQFNNPDNPYAHYTTTGPEIWQQTGGRITHFVSSMGTTGTITGVSRFMREQSKPVTIVGLQPEEGSSIPGIRRWPAEYLPGIFNASLVDEVLDIHQRDAENTMRELAVREGIFCGVSSGGAVAGALRVAKANPGAVVVAIICDRGDRYLSTGVFGEEHFSQGAGI